MPLRNSPLLPPESWSGIARDIGLWPRHCQGWSEDGMLVLCPSMKVASGDNWRSSELGSLCPEQSSNTIPAGSALATARKSHGRPKLHRFICTNTAKGESWGCRQETVPSITPRHSKYKSRHFEEPSESYTARRS